MSIEGKKHANYTNHTIFDHWWEEEWEPRAAGESESDQQSKREVGDKM